MNIRKTMMKNKYALIKMKLLSEAPPKTVLTPSANKIISTN